MTISTTVHNRELQTKMRFITGDVSHREHKQAIVANFIHSYDAYHLRQVIRALSAENIAIFPIHDCIVFDIDNIRVVRRVVADEFNNIYHNPEQILVNFYNSIVNHNTKRDFTDFDINQRISKLMGNAVIKAGLYLFHY